MEALGIELVKTYPAVVILKCMKWHSPFLSVVNKGNTFSIIFFLGFNLGSIS
jgi:hypothetical protein